ncbi:hypothetical protein MTO96_002167 [Rhipicephalus appendiculatus]
MPHVYALHERDASSDPDKTGGQGSRGGRLFSDGLHSCIDEEDLLDVRVGRPRDLVHVDASDEDGVPQDDSASVYVAFLPGQTFPRRFQVRTKT